MKPCAALVSVIVATSCGPSPPAELTTTASGSDTSDAAVTSVLPPSTSSSTLDLPSDPPTSTSTSTSTGPGLSSSPDDESCGNSSAPADSGEMGNCDVLLQDCPCGQKCTLVGLNDFGCVPLADDPVGEGSACQMDSQDHDDCDRGSFCPVAWLDISARCVVLCNEQGEGCLGDTVCMRGGQGDFLLSWGICLDPCDPLKPACVDGEECVSPFPQWLAPAVPFACLPAGEEGMLCDGCGGQTGCSSGFACSGSFSCGLDDDSGTCTPYCDLSMPACPDMLECQPWYQEPPPGLENVGLCL